MTLEKDDVEDVLGVDVYSYDKVYPMTRACRSSLVLPHLIDTIDVWDVPRFESSVML